MAGLRCDVKSPAAQDKFQPVPHELHWGDREMGTAISCTKCSQMAEFIHMQVECTLPYASKISIGEYNIVYTEPTPVIF